MSIHVKRNNSILEILIELPPDLINAKVELRICSEANRQVTRITESSPLKPPGESVATRDDDEVWYPVVDIVPDEHMEGVALFELNGPAQCTLNGACHKNKQPLKEELVISPTHIELWENDIRVEGEIPRLTGFYLRTPMGKQGQGSRTARFRTLRPDWAGGISAYALGIDGRRKLLGIEYVERGVISTANGAAKSERLVSALADTTGFLVRAQNRNENSPGRGGLFLFYDLDARTYRASHWTWTWGMAIGVLLRAASILGRDELSKVAGEIAEASLRFLVADAESPGRDMVVVRQDIRRNFGYGYIPSISPADSLFLAGWGWIPYYEATGDDRYLRAARKLALAIDRTNKEFPIVPQDYFPELGRWHDYSINESGFGIWGLAEIYRVTRDNEILRIAKEYIDQHMRFFQQEDGLWCRFYDHKRAEVIPPNHWSRGMGWGMMGLLGAHQMLPDGPYLDYAIKMAAILSKHQCPDGCWSHVYTNPESGSSGKATSLWAMLFYKLFGVSGEPEHLATAKRALDWCLSRQYRGDDPMARGSIIDINRDSGIVYRDWFRLACTYSSSFFGEALMEEMRIRDT